MMLLPVLKGTRKWFELHPVEQTVEAGITTEGANSMVIHKM